MNECEMADVWTHWCMSPICLSQWSFFLQPSVIMINRVFRARSRNQQRDAAVCSSQSKSAQMTDQVFPEGNKRGRWGRHTNLSNQLPWCRLNNCLCGKHGQEVQLNISKKCNISTPRGTYNSRKWKSMNEEVQEFWFLKILSLKLVYILFFFAQQIKVFEFQIKHVIYSWIYYLVSSRRLLLGKGRRK